MEEINTEQDNSPIDYAPAKPENYLAWSIVVTILCCWPLGIPAIVNAAKVDRLHAEGDHAGAQEASEKAKKWTIAAAVSGGVVILIYLLVVVVAGVGGGF